MLVAYNEKIAVEVGVKGSAVLQELHHQHLEGNVPLERTYEEWNNWMPYASYSTVRRTLEKLVESNIVTVFRVGVDRTSKWQINYSHPICRLLQDYREEVNNAVI